MRRLLGFLYERREYVALLLTVILSLYFIFSNSSPEIQILRGKANTVFSIIYSPVMWVRGISEIRVDNEILHEKVMQLELVNSSLLTYKEENDLLRSMLDYKRETQMELVSARVINMGISPMTTSITIDVGKNYNIEPNMAVISIHGTVGKTVTVGDKVSIVQIMPDYNFRISAKLEESGSIGILRWKVGETFELWEIPKPVEVRIGERVLTSGFSDIFPPNLPIGKVTGIIDRREMLHKIIIAKTYTDFSSLQHVFVVKK
ncbi:MAG: rod shape-determining protein MreC [Candidatus Marinimicrobia bacterium]|nr:rod shape-determining protein MreC [Candidatus Neomarinimicrobiota bacterium]